MYPKPIMDDQPFLSVEEFRAHEDFNRTELNTLKKGLSRIEKLLNLAYLNAPQQRGGALY